MARAGCVCAPRRQAGAEEVVQPPLLPPAIPVGPLHTTPTMCHTTPARGHTRFPSCSATLGRPRGLPPVALGSLSGSLAAALTNRRGRKSKGPPPSLTRSTTCLSQDPQCLQLGGVYVAALDLLWLEQGVRY